MSKTIICSVVSDLHCGSTVALCPEQGVMRADGSVHKPSKLQRWLWSRWLDYWKRVQRAIDREKNAEHWLVINGDMVEGIHHGSPQLIEASRATQQRAALKVLEVPRAMNPDHIFVVKGTEVHVGKLGEDEEKIAEWIGAEEPPHEPGQSTAYYWLMDVNGKRLRFQHHGSVGRLVRTRGSGISLAANEIWQRHAEREERHPDLVVQAHNHEFADSGPNNCPVRVVALPPWQFHTSHAHKVANRSLPEVGGVILRIVEHDPIGVTPVLYRPKLREAVWTKKN